MEEDSPQSSVEAPDALASSSTGNGNSLQHQQNVADEPRRPGKRNGPFKRSKTGCSTCKRWVGESMGGRPCAEHVPMSSVRAKFRKK